MTAAALRALPLVRLAQPSGGGRRVCRILMISADDLVQAALRYSLSNLPLGERRLELLFARSTEEAGHFAAAGRHGQQWQFLPGLGHPVYLETGGLTGEAVVQLKESVSSLLAGALRTVSLFSRLQSLAHYDQLCQLPNRPLFITRLDEALQAGGAWEVLIVDIDHFASVSHALGDRLGDALLQAVAARLADALAGCGAVLARIHTDNFAILAEEGSVTPSELLALFSDPVDVNRYLLPVSVTIGRARACDIEGGGERLLKAASTALKLAKQQARGGFRSYVPTMADEIQDRVRLLHDLKGALAQGAMAVHYQPQIDLRSGEPVGLEALVRWQHPERGMVRPDVFIGLAERSGLIIDLGEFVLQRACHDLARWHANGFPHLRVAVNVSMAQFRSPRFIPAIRAALAESGVPPQRLELEITESMLMGDAEAIVSTLQAIKALGVSVALDDFGTGFSSLSYLHTLPIDRLKVDRSFVRDIEKGRSGARIAEMVVSLGKTLGLQIVAEGIEQATEAVVLADWGCHEGQGFLYARPMPGDAVVGWMQTRTGRVHNAP